MRTRREDSLRPLRPRPLGEALCGATSFWARYSGVLMRSRLVRMRRAVLLDGGRGLENPGDCCGVVVPTASPP